MASFKQYYRSLFRTFGYPLTERTAFSAEVLAEAKKRLGIPIPAALRDYYLIAGCERRFNRSCHRLLPTEQWCVDKKRLVFMVENQGVGWWGVSIRNPDADDPPVSFGMDDEPITWHPEHRKCSVFLTVMLHYQAVAHGGFRYSGQADVPKKLNYGFEEHGWTYSGEVRSMQAFRRPNQVICLEPTGSLTEWHVFVGGKTKRDLKAIEAELGIALW